MATLVYSDADGRDRSFALGNEPVTVGRAVECAIRSEDPRVSRMHARFYLDQGSVWIEDLGSTHGIYVGPNKVMRAPVPTGEVILVGSLLIRLVPSSGTSPPPVGLHGTLATWLDLERKTRAAVEDERNAFAKRVGELHQELAARADVGTGRTLEPEQAGDGQVAEAVRLRDEAEARAAALERTLAVVQDELTMLRQAAKPDEDVARLRTELAAARARVSSLEADIADRAEWSTVVGAQSTKLEHELAVVKGALDEAQAAKSVAEHAVAEATRESQTLREDLDHLRRASAADLEVARLEVVKSREARMVAETSAGIAVVERLAETDLVIANLQRELAELKAKASAGPTTPQREADELVVVITGRAEKAEKDLAAAQIRAQGAERNLAGANAQAAKAETRAAQLEQKLEDAAGRVKAGEDELAAARERIAALETRLGAGDAPLEAAEGRAAKLAAELAELTSQFETRRDRIVELEKAVQAAELGVREADARTGAIQAELAAAAAKLAEADQRGGSLQAKLDELGKAEVAIAAATRARDDAKARTAELEAQITEAERRAEDAEKRASAADTMAKAMAKDVAEALRRAADADTQKRATARELAELGRRAEEAEAKAATAAAAIEEAEARIAKYEARTAEIQQELAGKLETTRQELADQLEATERELTARLEAAQRELAAERKTSLQLVDRKTQLERELADARTQLPAVTARAEAAEQRAIEHEVQIETLQDRIEDLESGMAVSETAQQASLAEAREELATVKASLAEATATSGTSGELVGELRRKLAELEQQLAETEQARGEADVALRDVRTELADLVRAAEQRAGSTASDRERLEEALGRASEAERKIDALEARAEAGELAIGRAGALQRQLDEALSRLALIERDMSSKARDTGRIEQSEAVAAERVASADARAQEAEARAKEAEARAQAADAQLADAEHRVSAASDRAGELADQLRELERRAQLAEEAAITGGDAERRAEAAEAMIAEAERRAEAAEAKLAAASSRVAGSDAFERQLFDAERRIAELEREVASADNVRSFAAETEREIAQLQRDLRDARTKLTQATLERDRLAADLRDARGDSETTNRRAPLDRKKLEREYDPEVTAQADVSKYESIIAKASDLQQRVTELEKQDALLRRQLAETELRLRDAIDTEDGAESTHTGSQLPLAFAEHLSVLEESIDSLRANMRAASDETAMMDQSDSVVAVSSAVSQAAEHVERARAAIRAMSASLDLES